MPRTTPKEKWYAFVLGSMHLIQNQRGGQVFDEDNSKIFKKLKLKWHTEYDADNDI